MTDNDLEVLYIGTVLVASKRKNYRDATYRYFKTLVHFLQDNGLTNRLLLEVGATPHDQFRVMKSDLTDEGFELIKYLDKWDKAIDSGVPIEDTTILEQELAKIRSK